VRGRARGGWVLVAAHPSTLARLYCTAKLTGSVLSWLMKGDST
jgi:hypothetical protein